MNKKVARRMIKECKEYLSKYSIDFDKYDAIATDEDDITANVQFIHKYTEAIIEISDIYHTKDGEIIQFITGLRINWDKVRSKN